MHGRIAPLIGTALLGAAFWLLVCWRGGVTEPWDADTYWIAAYPASLLLAAGLGVVFRRTGWLGGAVLTLAQLPILWLNNGAGGSWGLGLLFVGVLAVPAAALSALAGKVAARTAA